MELLLDTVDNSNEFMFNWDIAYEDGEALTVPETAIQDQEAAVTAFICKTTIPLMEDKGNDWVGFLLKSVTLTEVDAQVRNNLKTYLESVLYTPIYAADKGNLVVNMSKTIINTGAIE